MDVADDTHAQGRAAWLAHLTRVGRGHGTFSRIGARHLGLFVEEGDTLLVSFDRAERVESQSADGMPDGFALVREREWSFLSVMAIGPTWFRDPAVARFFEKLAADGVLGGYRRVIFAGLGPMCGHAAAAFSAARPGSAVLTSRPVASLAQRAAPFERRFRALRAADFDGRFGDAAAAVQAARAALVLYDPAETLSAAQAALFRGPAVTRVGVPLAGPFLDEVLRDGAAEDLLAALAEGRADAARVRALLRPGLRRHAGRLERLAAAALEAGHPDRAAIVARHAATVTGDRRFEGLRRRAEGAVPA